MQFTPKISAVEACYICIMSPNYKSEWPTFNPVAQSLQSLMLPVSVDIFITNC